jgi:hypothetical protein
MDDQQHQMLDGQLTIFDELGTREQFGLQAGELERTGEPIGRAHVNSPLRCSLRSESGAIGLAGRAGKGSGDSSDAAAA